MSRMLIVRTSGVCELVVVVASPTADALTVLINATSLELFCDTSEVSLWAGYCDGEGKLNGSQRNWSATQLAYECGWGTGDILFGDVAFVGPIDADGNDTDVPEHLVATALGHQDA